MTDITHLDSTVAALKATKEQIKALSETADTLSLIIKDALGDDDSGSIDGIPVVSYATVKRTAFSQKLCKELHPDTFEECKETTTARTFRIL